MFLKQRGIDIDFNALGADTAGAHDDDMPMGTQGNLREGRLADGSVVQALGRESKDAKNLRQGSVNLFRDLEVQETRERSKDPTVLVDLENAYLAAK